MLPLCTAPLASEACDLSAQVFRDPHINFAFGGSADLRGRHNALYNFLSAPGFSVNVKTEAAVFKMHGGALTINGTFLTEAHITAQLSTQKLATASFWASELDPNKPTLHKVQVYTLYRHRGRRGQRISTSRT